MATVNITNDLLNEVSYAVDRMRNSDYTTEFGLNFDPYRVKQDCSELLNCLIWDGKQNLLGVIPKKWLTPATEVTMRITLGGVSRKLVFEKQNSVYYRPGYSPYHDNRSTKELLDEALEAFGKRELLEQTFAKIQATIDHANRWEQIKKDIVQFLKGRKSLNEALKLMPNLKLYIPKKYIERVERKVERSTSVTPVNISLDRINELSAAAIGARLSGVSA